MAKNIRMKISSMVSRQPAGRGLPGAPCRAKQQQQQGDARHGARRPPAPLGVEVTPSCPSLSPAAGEDEKGTNARGQMGLQPCTAGGALRQRAAGSLEAAAACSRVVSPLLAAARTSLLGVPTGT